jgi:beta-glucosidase-like glycosyl hydrolase
MFNDLIIFLMKLQNITLFEANLEDIRIKELLEAVAPKDDEPIPLLVLVDLGRHRVAPAADRDFAVHCDRQPRVSADVV